MTRKIFRQDEGSVLLITIATIAVVAIALTSYLALVSNQNKSVARSTAWNQAIPVLEGGLEEALTQIHYQGTNNLTANGWTLGSDNYYHKTRTYSDGNYYSVTIIPTNPPSIVSTGYVVVPFSGSSSTQYVSRRVRVKTRSPNPGGMVAKGNISMNGNPFIDSYDSGDPSHSTTNGTYNPATRETNAVVLSDSGNINATTIYGNAVTGPSGSVSGTVKGAVTHNANVQFDDVPAPFAYGTGLAPDTGILGLGTLIKLTNYAYVLRTGNYNMSSLGMSGGAMYVGGNPSVLYINGSVSMSGSGYVYVATGASLQLYLNGSADLSGGGMINGTGPATNVYIYGMTNCTSIKMSGGSAVNAVVYAPDADVTYTGNADFSGAITGNSISLKGNGSFHYDQAISDTGFVVVSWNEF